MRTISRAQFLRGDWGGEKPVLRPPWALPEDRFAAACNGCGDCLPACPEDILKINGRGLPEIDFATGACTFCKACAEACPTGAIRVNGRGPQAPWRYKAAMSNGCLAMNGTACVRCIECCPEDAILARPALQGKTVMEINDSDCTGCGACVSGCPVNAISMTAPTHRAGDPPNSTGGQDEPVVHQ